jgi:hypothetical protein
MMNLTKPTYFNLLMRVVLGWASDPLIPTPKYTPKC